MSDVTVDELRASLEAERASLRQQLDDLGFGDTAGHAYDANFADSSQVTAERGEAEAVAQKLRETLDEVEHALGKIDEGAFGTCENCGKQISPARLEVMPAARYCIDCASLKR
jgi:RNA polymerase-binding transcription factor DksA